MGCLRSAGGHGQGVEDHSEKILEQSGWDRSPVFMGLGPSGPVTVRLTIARWREIADRFEHAYDGSDAYAVTRRGAASVILDAADRKDPSDQYSQPADCQRRRVDAHAAARRGLPGEERSAKRSAKR